MVWNRWRLIIGFLWVLRDEFFFLEKKIGKNFFEFFFEIFSPLPLIMIFPGFVSIAFIVVLSMGFLPESPKYLISIDKEAEARQALETIRGTSYNCDQELDAMMGEKSSSAGGETSISGLFSIPGIRWQLFTLIFMHIAQPMSGINAVFFYSNDIFKSVGVEEGSLAYYSIALFGGV